MPANDLKKYNNLTFAGQIKISTILYQQQMYLYICINLQETM